MIPLSPLQFTLWGSALYTELAAGLWRALAAPWLQPGWPISACAPERQHADKRGPSSAAGRADDERSFAERDVVSEPRPAADPAEQRVIEVPRGRWQGRRARGPTSQTEG